jgi:hypothetical protein
MIYAEIKDQEERIRLQDAMKASKNKNWYRRLQVIELSAEKYCQWRRQQLFWGTM